MLKSFLYIYPHLFPLLSIQSKINGFANAFLQYKITKSNRKVKENQRLGHKEVEASARDTNTSYHHIILGRWHQCTWLLAKMLLPGVYTAMDTLAGPSMIHLMASIWTPALISCCSPVQGRMAVTSTTVYEFGNVVRSQHVYKSVWTTLTHWLV